MDPHEDLFSPPPAYSEQEFDRKIAQAAQLSEQTAKWEKPRLDVDEDGWPLYDPSLFEEKPKPSSKGMYKPEPPAAATSSTTANVEAPTASSSRQSQDGRDSSPRLAKIVPLRIAKKTKAQEAAEDAEPSRYQSFASGSSMRSDAQPTTNTHSGPSNPSLPPPVEHQHYAPPYAPTYSSSNPAPANVHSAAPSELPQTPQSLPHQTPFVPAYSLEATEPHQIEPQGQSINPHRSPHDTPLVPTYSLEAPDIRPLSTGPAKIESQIYAGHESFSERPVTQDTPAAPTYTLEAPDDHRSSVLINPHDLRQEALQRTPIAPSHSLEISRGMDELAVSFNQPMSMSRQTPSPVPQQSSSQAQSYPSHSLQGHAPNPYLVDARTPTTRTQVLQPVNPEPPNNSQFNIPQGGLPSQFEPERSWTPSLEPLDLPPSNGHAQNNSYNPYLGPSYSQPLPQAPVSPQTPRYSMPPPQPSLPRMTIPQRPQSSQPTTYNQPQPVPRLIFNPHSAYSGVAPAARFLGPQKPSAAVPFDAGSFYNSAISSQLKNTPIKTASYSSYQPSSPQPPQQQTQNYNTMASSMPPINLSRQSVHWQSPGRPVSIYSTMTNPNPTSYDTNANTGHSNNQYAQYPTNPMQSVPENNWYTHR
ncbi:hypothetical protein CPB83DRAFT_844012 [Crepidotus variabilis]|uniref:Uncharacterized protein n=1 Tax=Crepidotus variabilis TaxID=179855 RepID=A0A9P6JVA2_9AGAR|nr:hypothetical protein CPB83DRAFT_844012 [Crepidotus variabilis]